MGSELICHSAVDLHSVNMERALKDLGVRERSSERKVRRELALVVSVTCGKKRDITRGWQLFSDTNACNLELVRCWATRVRVMKCDHSVQCMLWDTVRICTCCLSGYSVHTFRRLSWSLSPSSETGPKLRRHFHELSNREECLEFQLLVVQLLRSQFVDEDEDDRSPRDSLQTLQSVWGSTAKSYSWIPSNAGPFRSLTCWLRRIVLLSCWVLVRCSSCNRLHSLFAWAKSGRRCNGCLGLDSVWDSITSNFEIFFAFVVKYEEFSNAVLSWSLMCSFVHPISDNDFSVMEVVVPSTKYGCISSDFFLTSRRRSCSCRTLQFLAIFHFVHSCNG